MVYVWETVPSLHLKEIITPRVLLYYRTSLWTKGSAKGGEEYAEYVGVSLREEERGGFHLLYKDIFNVKHHTHTDYPEDKHRGTVPPTHAPPGVKDADL